MLRFPSHPALAAAASVALIASGTTALARDGESGWRNGSWYGSGETPPPPPPVSRNDGEPSPLPQRDLRPYDSRSYAQAQSGRPQFDPAGRDAWLADCRSRVSSRDNGVGGAVIGGAVGGVVGNRVAGRHNRTVGTLAGAAVGAVAGSAIDRAEDRGRERDECEAYLDDYYARYSANYGASFGYAQGYAGSAYVPAYAGAGCCASAPVMMVPVQAAPQCTETVEYIYEDVPVRRTYRRPVHTKVVHDKRVKIVPDKRVYVGK